MPASAVAPDVEIDRAQYAHPHELIDIGGRRLNLFCMGSGSPTVMFDAGAGEAGWDWMLVQTSVSKKTKACVYDRAGLGFSDPSPRPGTSGNAVDDLHALLAAAKLSPPFVLVAHSYAAMNAQLFAYRYPTWVSGLVLLDGQHEDELVRMDRITGGTFSQKKAEYAATYRHCADAAKNGFAPGSEAFTTCVGPAPDVFGRALSAAYLAQLTSARFWQASWSELENLNTVSSDQLRSARKSFGDLPIACLTRGVSPYLIPGKPQSAINKAIERENKTMQDEVAGLSTNGTNRVAVGANHGIPLQNPRAVIDAIDEVLSKQHRESSHMHVVPAAD